MTVAFLVQASMQGSALDWLEERMEGQSLVDDFGTKYVPPHIGLFNPLARRSVGWVLVDTWLVNSRRGCEKGGPTRVPGFGPAAACPRLTGV